VVVVVGVTEILPEPSPTGTAIFPGFTVPEVAFTAVQFSVAVQPREMSPAETRLPEGALPPTATAAVAVSCDAAPQGAVIVSVYVVLADGPGDRRYVPPEVMG